MRDADIPKWLEGLPLAPEFRPTDTEFADPIAYISKIEREASAFGICKVIPPIPKPSKKYVLSNLNKTLSKCPELGSDVNLKKFNDEVEGTSGSEVKAVFTTRQQELGQCGKKAKTVESQVIGAPKQVWQSGEVYTLDQFEAKSKTFAKSQFGMVKEVSPLVVETLFWKSASEKPIYVEYANDVPGSGFGEPEGSLLYFNKRRRRRRKRGTFDRNIKRDSCSENNPVENSSSIVNNNMADKDGDVSNLLTQKSEVATTQKSEVATSSSPLLSDQFETISEERVSSPGNEMHGTAGWKLSNSSWNLQVVARSPGSLTRYMPDDIPGVTSPMVYIGMLFSWFAWHVEDHELHSLNFLHMGSPKTWYSVPGDFASSFEEVIRVHAYGRSTNPVDALTRLGEKTTLVSPEVIVASGIPCCRLVQNPGEFVVTFPRAYHVGFSHGFNCGEAANFSTPRWLTVAKEAAVRRAAMNYLPMLSHQQLLYLLTMSFISRVPRSLLPGGRSSRLKDRQKEERELAVKKAFIDDILKENRLLTMLLQKNTSCRVVLWNLNLLTASNKDSELCSQTDGVEPKLGENSLPDKYNTEDLYTQMSLYMETVSDFYLDDADDLQNDYQVDSGTLPCVACGILGFPFMAVVQPSEQASWNLLPENWGLVPEVVVSQPVESEARVLNIGSERSTLEHTMGSSATKQESKWNLSNGFLRPRLFCLEHAIQTVELLLPKGGANVLGICHSDFEKIKAHSAVVAEEIKTPFTYNEIQLQAASQEDLYLIDHAVDYQEKDECVKDWSSELNVNMQHIVNMRKKFPSLKMKHALTLDGLFSDAVFTVNAFKWESRRSRSKRSSNVPVLNKIDKVDEAVVKLDGEVTSKQGRVSIQYYRKRYKSKPRAFDKASKLDSDEKDPEDLLVAHKEVCRDKKHKDMSVDTLIQVEDVEEISSAKCMIQSDTNLSVSKLEDSAIDTNLEGEMLGGCSGNSRSEKQIEINRKCDPTVAELHNLPNSLTVEKASEKPDTVSFGKSPHSLAICFNENENSEVMKEKSIVSEVGSENRVCDPVETIESGKRCNVQADGDVLIKDVDVPAKLCCYADDSSGVKSNEHSEMSIVDKCGMHGELVNCSTANCEVLQEIQASEGEEEEKAISCDDQLSSKYNNALVDEAEKTREMLNSNKQQQSSSSEGSSSSESKDLDDSLSTEAPFQSTEKSSSKRKRVDVLNEDPTDLFGSFIRSPCEGLRPRGKTDPPANVMDSKNPAVDKNEARKAKKDSHPAGVVLNKGQKLQKKGSHRCDVDGCQMRFQTKGELGLHLRNRCPVKGCGKKFNSHKYAVLHQRVHDDDRPLKCPWKGCTMTFKWAWARTEHIRVHTGERPYKCKVEGCGLTFRFVSDFSRHRRKTGHYLN